jgi:hypothetical protein
MDEREKRLAQNEALFREVNEKVETIAAQHGDDDHIYEFYCECSNADCTLHVPATLGAYEQVRAYSNRFLIFPGHALPDIENVLERGEGHWVVEKTGDAASYVSRLDPRQR